MSDISAALERAGFPAGPERLNALVLALNDLDLYTVHELKFSDRCVVPQTVFTLRGSDGVGLEGPWFVTGSGRAAGSAQTLYLCTKMDLTLKRTVSETNFKGTFAPNLVNSSKNCTHTHQTQ